MDENAQVFTGFLAIIPSLVYSVAYAIGGRDKAPLFRPRIWKRIIAPLLFSTLVILLSLFSRTFKPLMLLYIPCFITAHYLIGYGGDTLWVKLRRRFLSGLVIGLTASLIAVFANAYVFLGMQVFLAISAHLVLGILNPLKASHEELLIALCTVLFVPFTVL